MKKYLFTTMLFLLLPMFIVSQTLNIYTKDGTIHNYTISYIDSISAKTVIQFDCGNTVSYQGKTYNTVQIGEQCWFKENLGVGTVVNVNRSQTGSQQSNNGIIEKYCYENDTNNCNIYGGLYEWHEAMQYSTAEGTQGICPIDWHIPTKGEFDVLKSYINDSATKLIDESQVMGDGSFGTNETGFSALFGGYFLYQSSEDTPSEFKKENSTRFFTSSIFMDGSTPMYLGYYIGNGLGQIAISSNNGMSVRCIRD